MAARYATVLMSSNDWCVIEMVICRCSGPGSDCSPVHASYKPNNEWTKCVQDRHARIPVVSKTAFGSPILHSDNLASYSAVSEPKGPVYLYARREVLEEELDPAATTNAVDLKKWPAISPTGLSPDGMSYCWL